jgi:hypothetical protein
VRITHLEAFSTIPQPPCEKVEILVAGAARGNVAAGAFLVTFCSRMDRVAYTAASLVSTEHESNLQLVFERPPATVLGGEWHALAFVLISIEVAAPMELTVGTISRPIVDFFRGKIAYSRQPWLYPRQRAATVCAGKTIREGGRTYLRLKTRESNRDRDLAAAGGYLEPILVPRLVQYARVKPLLELANACIDTELGRRI